METKARLIDARRDTINDETIVTFSIKGNILSALDKLRDKLLKLKVVKWYDKRSLDSNDYMWVLTEEIAKAQAEQMQIPVTKEEVHKRQLIEFGYTAYNEWGLDIDMYIPFYADIDAYPGYWRPSGRDSLHEDMRRYIKIKGTSEYDSKEMNVFLMYVIDEAKELGIETATPDELERMRQLYENKRSGR